MISAIRRLLNAVSASAPSYASSAMTHGMW
jgi:hypothetical protein